METALRQIDERRYGDIFDEALCSRYYASQSPGKLPS